jgi:mitotic-spindle organizing protein 1
VLSELATVLNTGLDRETVSICVALCESGVNPEALAAVIKELRREASALQVRFGACVLTPRCRFNPNKRPMLCT